MPCQTPYRGDTSQMLLFKIASCLAEGGGLGVFSFNGRTGVVTLTSGDVTTALGFTPLSQAIADDLYVNETGDSMTGALAIDNGILAASTPYLTLAQTWNNGAVTFTGLQSNITNTASNTNSNLFNFQVDGVDRFNFTPGGSFRAVRQDASDSGLNFFLRKRGDVGGATNAVANDSTIGTVAYSGWDGAAFATGSRISGLAGQAWTGAAHGARIDLYTTPVGSVTEQLTMRVAAAGSVQFLNGTAALPSITFQSNLDMGMYRDIADRLAFATVGVRRAVIDFAGNFAVGGLTYNSSRITSAGTLLNSSAGGTWGIVSQDLTSMALGVGGSIMFVGYKTGTSAVGNFAGIRGLKENGTAADESGFLAFSTSTSGGTLTERARISSAGLVGINTTVPNSTLDIRGSTAHAYVAKTAVYTATISDYTIDCIANTFTVSLPTAVGITGRIYVIKNSGAGVITIDPSGAETIDGAATTTVIAGASVTTQSTGANWIII